MTSDGRQAAGSEEMSRAEEELKGADALLTAGLVRIALTRAYFAAFHAARALLFAEGLEPRSHRGALHLFNVHFVRSGRFEPPTSRLLSRLQRFREEADYSEDFVIDGAGAKEELEAARAFVQRVADVIAAQAPKP